MSGTESTLVKKRSRYALLSTALVLGVSLAVCRTVADFVPPDVLLPLTRWTVGYAVIGAVYGGLMRFLVFGRLSIRQTMLVGALAFGSTYQVLMFSWGWLFDGYALFPLGWPWSGLVLFAVLGGVSSSVVARYGELRIPVAWVGVGSVLTFGAGEGIDLIVRNYLFPLLNIPAVTIPIALMVHGVANFCCGLVVGFGVWMLTARTTANTPLLKPPEGPRWPYSGGG